MMTIKTVTLAEIRTLKRARDEADAWKGNHAPESFDEFEAWIATIDAAIESVERDRLRLQGLLSPLWASRDRARKEVMQNKKSLKL